MKTPDQQVADAIVAELRKRKIIAENRLKVIESNLSSGTLSADSWRLAFEPDPPAKSTHNVD